MVLKPWVKGPANVKGRTWRGPVQVLDNGGEPWAWYVVQLRVDGPHGKTWQAAMNDTDLTLCVQWANEQPCEYRIVHSGVVAYRDGTLAERNAV